MQPHTFFLCVPHACIVLNSAVQQPLTTTALSWQQCAQLGTVPRRQRIMPIPAIVRAGVLNMQVTSVAHSYSTVDLDHLGVKQVRAFFRVPRQISVQEREKKVRM